ncbi:MAG: hypothetical protein K2Y51_20260 [Gammaproteobacteria bacterium]|nr:hypothetical protein [Gammaproteobacteria bacterium]
MDSAYVDFMNRLTHPDPAQRMTASEALRHPFLTQQLGDPDKLEAVLGLHPPPAPPAQPVQGTQGGSEEDGFYTLDD